MTWLLTSLTLVTLAPAAPGPLATTGFSNLPLIGAQAVAGRTLLRQSIGAPSLVAQSAVGQNGGGETPPASTSASGDGGDDTGGPAKTAETPGFGSTLLVMGLIFLFFWLFFIRPQNKQMKEHKSMVAALKKGDAVVTQGGMFGRITGFDDSTGAVILEISKDVRVRVVRSQISRQQASIKDEQKKA